MAEVSTVHSLHHQPNLPQILPEEDDEEEERYVETPNSIAAIRSDVNNVNDDDGVNVDVFTFNFDPLSPFNSSFFTPSSSHLYHHNSNSDSDFGSNFESESEFSDSASFPNCSYGDDQMIFVTDLFASREECPTGDSNSFRVDDDFGSNYEHELGLEFEIEGNEGGLRIVGIGSDSDTEELDANSAVYDDDDGAVDNGGSADLQIYREFEWEEVQNGLSSSVIDRIEEVSISSEISSSNTGEEEAVRALEWEILLAVNNLERALEFETDGDGYVHTAEFDTLIAQFVESVSALKGSPPAAKSVIDNLPPAVLKKEDMMENCAVCKDQISVEEKVVQLPCSHHYHGDCIVPWLSIRNTCPVCRFELPTDDLDYERSKNRSGGGGVLDLLDEDLQEGWV